MGSFKKYLREAKYTEDEMTLAKEIANKMGLLVNDKLPSKHFYNTGTGTSKLWHLRFQAGENDEQVINFFKNFGLNVKVADLTLSGSFTTYQISKGNMKVFFVNTSRSNSSVKTKELSPDIFPGLATGKELSGADIINIVTKVIDTRLTYNDSIKRLLRDSLKVSFSKGNNQKINISGVTEAELKTISADFGEICAALWSLKNIGFRKVSFPTNISQPLMDFFGHLGKIKYPVSVKSGGGSPTSIKNIENLIKERIENEDFKLLFSKEEQKVLNALDIMNELTIIEGMIRAHIIFETESIKILSRIIKVPFNQINEAAVMSFIKGKKSPELKDLLEPFYDSLNNYVSDATWTKYDKGTMKHEVGLIVGPLGNNIVKVFNNRDSRNALTKVARSVTLLQMNIDIKTSSIKFKREKFKKFKFEFKWQGSSTNPTNRLGFVAKVGR